MFADLGFSFTLAARADGSTTVRNESYYRPRSVLASLLSVLMMRRKFRGIRHVALSNLRRLSEAAANVGSQVDPRRERTLVTGSSIDQVGRGPKQSRT
jgi:hypothetical protein